MLRLTREAIINDDLGAFAAIENIASNAAGATEAKILIDLLTSNPPMGDGSSLFHASHKNVGTAAAIGIDSLSAARKAMRLQTGIANDLITVEPKFLIVGPNLETAAEQILAQLSVTKISDVNPFAKALELIVEPRISDNRWYVSANPATTPGLEYAYLSGQIGPHIETRTDFSTDAYECKVRLDFGAGFVDHRGWYFNAGL